MAARAKASLRRQPGVEQRATSLELFYDLVFVFAITQVSHLLLEHLTWEGAGQSALVLLVVWWSWNYTTWVTNELDPDSIAVRILLIGLMLASFLMAIAIPDAFGDKALLFAGSYVAIQIGRHTFLTFAAAGPGTLERARAGRILVWFVAAGVFWIAGALCEAVCAPLGFEPPIYRRRVDFFTKSRAFDIRRAQREIGYAPQVRLHDGIQRTIEWYRAHGWL